MDAQLEEIRQGLEGGAAAWASVKEAMDALGVSETAICQLRRRGKFPGAIKDAKTGRVLIPWKEIDARLERMMGGAEDGR